MWAHNKYMCKNPDCHAITPFFAKDGGSIQHCALFCFVVLRLNHDDPPPAPLEGGFGYGIFGGLFRYSLAILIYLFCTANMTVSKHEGDLYVMNADAASTLQFELLKAKLFGDMFGDKVEACGGHMHGRPRSRRSGSSGCDAPPHPTRRGGFIDPPVCV
jgi:hypothetical protein